MHIETITWFFRITAVLVPPTLAALGYRYSTHRLARTGLRVATYEREADSRFESV
jgi:hypothetical protein